MDMRVFSIFNKIAGQSDFSDSKYRWNLIFARIFYFFRNCDKNMSSFPKDRIPEIFQEFDRTHVFIDEIFII